MSDLTILEDRRLALHNLLDLIMVTRAEQPDMYRRINRHVTYLKEWFMSHLNWRLLSGPGLYRLERLPSSCPPNRGLPRLRTPMDYACLCWALWFAETRYAATHNWFVISELAAEISRAAEGRFSLGQRLHREALVRSLELLDQLGILTHRDGDASLWVSGQDTGDEPSEVLYEFTDSGPRLLANFDFASLDQLDDIPAEQLTLPVTGEHAPPLVRALRCLILGPILWQDDDPEAFSALVNNAEQVEDELVRALGWDLEFGRVFARIWRTTTARRARSVLIDLVPEPGAEPGAEPRRTKYIFHPILLVLGEIRRQLESGRLAVNEQGAVPTTGGRLRDMLARLHREYRRSWGVELGEQMGFEQLFALVMGRMRQIGLLRGPDAMDRAIILPTAALITGEYKQTGPAKPRSPRVRSQAAEQLSILE